MIVDVLFLVAGALLTGVSFLLSLLNYVVPDQAEEAIGWAFSQLAYLQAFFPINTLLKLNNIRIFYHPF